MLPKTGPTWITIPESEAEILHTINSYAHIGLPGCISSFDVVHIAWDKCPAFLQNLFTGFVSNFRFEFIFFHYAC